jgi:hypothetical protein
MDSFARFVMESRESVDGCSLFTSQSSTGSKGKRVFHDDLSQGLIGEILRFLVVWQEMGVDGGEGPQGVDDASGGLSPSGISVQQEKDAGGLGEPGDVIVKELGSKKRDHTGNACLRESYGSPGALDDNHSLVAERLGTVGIVEHMSLGEVLWKAPLAEASDLIGKEEAGAVAEGTALKVVQAHGHGVFEKGGASCDACLEVEGGVGRDLLDVLEEAVLWIEGD